MKISQLNSLLTEFTQIHDKVEALRHQELGGLWNKEYQEDHDKFAFLTLCYLFEGSMSKLNRYFYKALNTHDSSGFLYLIQESKEEALQLVHWFEIAKRMQCVDDEKFSEISLQVRRIAAQITSFQVRAIQAYQRQFVGLCAFAN